MVLALFSTTISLLTFFLDIRVERFHLVLSHFIFPISIIFLLAKKPILKKTSRYLLLIIFPLTFLFGLKSFFVIEVVTLHHWFHISFVMLLIVSTFFLRNSPKNIIARYLSIIFVGIILTGTLSVVGTGYFRTSNLSFETDNTTVNRFNKKIRPILQKKCQSCHNSTIASGNLDLTSSRTINSAGKTNKFVHPNLYFSGFFKRTFLMSHQEKHMPKGRGRLSDQELVQIENWVKEAQQSELGPPSSDQYNSKTPSWILKPKASLRTTIQDSIAGKINSSKKLNSKEFEKKLSLRLTGLLPKESKSIDKLLSSKGFSQNMTGHFLDFIGYKENKTKPSINLKFINRVESFFYNDESYLSFLEEILRYKGIMHKDLRDNNFFTFQKFERDEEFDKTLINAARASIDNLYQFTLGARMECAKCHDHRYAPISNSDYYNQVNELKSFYELGDIKEILENSTKADPKAIYLEAFTKDSKNLPYISIDKWLVDLSNSGVGFYTSRQYVNFIWATLNGKSLVETPEDLFHIFEPPAHIDLLNSLTYFFLENSLSTKALIKKIITSPFYKMEHDYGKEKYKISQRTRLKTELLRDNLLYLVDRLGREEPNKIIPLSFDLNQSHRSIYYLRQGSELLNIDEGGKVQFTHRNFSNLGDTLLLSNKNLITPYLEILEKKFPLKNIQDLTKAYEDILNRAPIESEIEVWKDIVVKKKKRKIFLHSLISSNEFGYIK